MQDAIGHESQARSYLQMLPEAELRRLASRLSPSVRKQLFSHLAGDSAPPSPPRPRVTAPTPTTCGTGVGSEPPRRQQAPFENPLLTTAEVQALIPAVIPNARRWLREVDLSARNAAANQKELKELGRFVIKTEQARQASEAERARLYHLCEHQSQALVASAARMASQRRAYEEQSARLRWQEEHSRQLERGLRAMARAQAYEKGNTGLLGVRPPSIHDRPSTAPAQPGMPNRVMATSGVDCCSPAVSTKSPDHLTTTAPGAEARWS